MSVAGSPSSRLARYLRPSPGQLLVIGIHLVAFALLYLSFVRLMQRELLLAHSGDLREILRNVVGFVHDSLAEGDRERIRERVEQARVRYGLEQLELTDANGWSLTQEIGGRPRLLAGHRGADDVVTELSTGHARGRWVLSGTVRIDSVEHCGPCHVSGQVLGTGRIGLDLTADVVGARGRIRRNVGVLIGVWLVILGVVNLASRRMASRWLRRLQRRMKGAGPGGESDDKGVAQPMMVDPISREMYRSLHRAIREISDREERVAGRIHHTEKLASLGQIAAGLAHEVKNPLAGIHGALELLRDDTEDAARRTLYEQMIGEVDRVNGILHLLLRFARPGRVRKTSTDVQRLVGECASLLRYGLHRKGTSLEIEVSSGLGSFSLDPGQIKQVLVNLIGNAAEAIEQNGRIVVRASRFPEGRGLVLSVEDDGPGIPPEHLDRIFEPFFTTKFSGTGLGLAVCRSLVHQHGGTLEARSAPGEGASFFVLLPEDGTPARENEEDVTTDAGNGAAESTEVDRWP